MCLSHTHLEKKLSIPNRSKNPESRFLFDPSPGARIAIQRPLLNLPENVLRETSVSSHPLYMDRRWFS